MHPHQNFDSLSFMFRTSECMNEKSLSDFGAYDITLKTCKFPKPLRCMKYRTSTCVIGTYNIT